MSRKYMTELFPWLTPIRQKQRKTIFYIKMQMDKNQYAGEQSENKLPYYVFESKCLMYNENTGFDMKYQENKVFNLKLAAQKLDGLLIRPGETVSFWERTRYADKEIPYRDGLAEVNGELTTQYGGGLCQISNLLCWVFLHTPLTIVERHGHRKKDFPEPVSDAPLGVDATVYEGWLDFKVRNDTKQTYQLSLTFDDTHIIGAVYAAEKPEQIIKVMNKNLNYFQEGGEVFEVVNVVKCIYDAKSCELISEKNVYQNRCRIGYPLPEGTKLLRKDQD